MILNLEEVEEEERERRGGRERGGESMYKYNDIHIYIYGQFSTAMCGHAHLS